MSWDYEIRKKLRELGFVSHMDKEMQAMKGAQLTVCQLIVVILSFASVVFIFVPFLYLKDPLFMVIFFGLSLVCLSVGLWFWINRSKICENPEEAQE